MDYPKSVPGVGLVNGKFVDEDQNAGTVGSIIPSVWGNGVTDELIAVALLLAGAAADETKLTQVRDAIVAAVRGLSPATIATDTGAVNALVADLSPVPAQLDSTMRIRVKVKATNTAAATLNLNGKGVKPIFGEGLVALQGGELIADQTAEFEYGAALNGGTGAWVLVDGLGGGVQVAAPTKSKHAVNLETADGRYAALAGLVTQVFNVAAPTLGGHAVNLNEFFASLTGNGCVKIPVIAGGTKRTMIVQWGSVAAVPAGSGSTWTFPMAFPNAYLAGVACFNNSGGISGAAAGGIGSPTPTTATLFNNGSAGASQVSAIVIGW